ncbi:SMR family transporter [Bacillus sp. DTU_2020_1000418_1_SI_GHA_SEK_038]|uniref:DMT family transporter n=1 Tax=Bacillus sp. DTU_2020_1000418_1_SI_GHA_SEK_038 TaxID=3077585 RepID=UPI0028F14404|nr:SMR family transporter [Bacillus sp. DTU_2020_1000418_1_SI_GHA_SEK_038]WNS75847.1 SMR family transporter [Bacillus sp. DTU_2020_1000418_1_SI_GHA_SEK_038]
MKNQGWIYVMLTCLFELIWIYGFNEASTWWHWVIVIGIIFIDFHFLPKACETLPTGTVYAVFAGAGTVGTVLMDVFLFGGSFSLGKIFFIALLAAGVIGLNMADNKAKKEAM